MQYLFIIIAVIILGSAALAAAAPWIPTRRREVDRILTFAELRPGQIFYDLGSGDGRLIFKAAQKYHAQAIGIELSLLPYLYSKIKQLFGHNPQIQIKFKNLFKENLSQADIVFIYLMPSQYPRLIKKLRTELKPGAKVITAAWPIDEWTPLKTDKPGEDDIALYLYRI